MSRRLWAAANVPLSMARSGLLRPGRPDRVVRQLARLARWGTTLTGEFVSAAGRDPGRPAIVDERGTFTFAEVDQRTSRLAAGLAGLGVGPGTRVGLLCRNHGGLVESLIACGKLGADSVLLNTGAGAAQLPTTLAEQGVTLVVADAEFRPALAGVPGSVRRVIAWTHEGDGDGDGDRGGEPTLDGLIAQGSSTASGPPERPGRVVILTSGTTGSPKGARRPPRPGLKPLGAMLSRIPLRVHDRLQLAAPLFHTWGYAGLQLGIGLRATLVLRRHFDPEAALRTVHEHRCTAIVAIPIMLQRILDLPGDVRERYDTSCLRVVATSGSSLPGDLATRFMDAFGGVLYNLYGSTEASWVSIAQPQEMREVPGTSGRPPRGTRVAILDSDGRPVDRGTTGRIFVVNDMLFEGYTSGEKQEIRDGLLSTGDVGHLDEAGRLFVEGRDDDMIVSGGENVFPREVEDLLASLPEVREAAVVGVADAEYGQRLAAYIVVRPGERLNADTVRQRVRERLARFCVPRDVHFLDELPRNPTGKVLVSQLPTPRVPG